MVRHRAIGRHSERRAPIAVIFRKSRLYDFLSALEVEGSLIISVNSRQIEQ
jgi:hypothetical protein